MDRYKFTSVKLNSENKRIYESTIYPTIDYTLNDVYIETVAMDRLDNIAYRYYNDSRYWWILATVNNLGKGSFMVPPGTVLRIPRNIELIIEELNKLQFDR